MAVPVDIARPHDHADRGKQIRDRRDPADRQIRQMIFLQDQRQPDADAVGPQREAELDRGADQHADIFQRRQQRGMRPLAHFGRQHVAQHVALLRVSQLALSGSSASRYSVRKPSGMQGMLTRMNSHCHPARPQMPSICSSIPQTGPPTSDGRRNPDQEPGQHPRAVLRRKPGGEEKRHAGKESGFGEAEQKPRAIEAVRPDHEGVQRRHQPPADHDPRQPAPRAEPVEHQIAGDLEHRIAEEENAGGEAELARPSGRAACSWSARQSRGWCGRDS